VFYQSPLVRPDGSFKIEYDFVDAGRYIGVVTAGHPTNDNIYAAVFPFSVGEKSYKHWLAAGALLAVLAGYLWRRRKATSRAQ
jgi:LPXTG-motif cell wall-anchored protein